MAATAESKVSMTAAPAILAVSNVLPPKLGADAAEAKAHARAYMSRAKKKAAKYKG
eukprot:SAG31_NODE_319_length_17776_cov_4.703570_5_plen_56_part_00